MTLDDRVYVQRKILKKIRLLFILNYIRRNVRSHYKKEDKKRNTITNRNKINNKKRYVKKSRIRISKETINILRR